MARKTPAAPELKGHAMPKRTYPRDAERLETADDIEDVVADKREGWRATAAKGRRRQRRYKKLLTRQIMRFSDTPEDQD